MPSKLIKIFLNELLKLIKQTGILEVTPTLLLVLSAAVDLSSETSFSHVGTISGDRLARKSRRSCRIL